VGLFPRFAYPAIPGVAHQIWAAYRLTSVKEVKMMNVIALFNIVVLVVSAVGFAATNLIDRN